MPPEDPFNSKLDNLMKDLNITVGKDAILRSGLSGLS